MCKKCYTLEGHILLVLKGNHTKLISWRDIYKTASVRGGSAVAVAHIKYTVGGIYKLLGKLFGLIWGKLFRVNYFG